MRRNLLSLLVAVLLLTAVILPLGSSAAEMGDPPQIIINAGSGQVFDGDNDFFQAYKIFSVTFSGDNYSYTLLPEFYAFIDYPDYLTMSLQEYLDTQPGYEEMTELATALWNYIYYEGYDPLDIIRYVEPVGDVNVTESQVTIDLDVIGGGYGYYLVFHSVSADNGGEPSVSIIAACSLTTTNPVAVVTPKADVPTLRKNIVKDDGTLTKVAGVTVGETINFVIEVTLPKTYEGYDDYLFVLHDEFSGVSGAFIGFDPTGEDYLDGIMVSMWEPGEPTTIEPFPTTGYTLTQNWPGFDIEFNFEALLEIPEGYELLVEYSGVVNGEAASVGTTTKVVNSAWLEFGANPYTESSINSIEEKVWLYVGCLDDVWKVDGTTKNVVEGAWFEKIDDLDELPTGNGFNVAFSSDGKYLAITSIASPFITVYKMVDGIPARIPYPNVLPPNITYSAAFSPDGKFLAVVHFTYPFLTIYDMTNDIPTKIPDPDELPSATGRGVAFSSDGKYLAIANSNASGMPQVIIYNVSDDVFSYAYGLNIRPGYGDIVFNLSFSLDGKYLAIAHNGSPFLAIYDMTEDPPLRMPDPNVLPTGNVHNVIFSPNGQYLAMSHDASPYVTIYDMTNGNPIKITNPDILPTGVGRGVSFSSNGKYLAVVHNTAPFITIYDMNNGEPIKVSNPNILPTGIGQGVAFSNDGKYLAIAYNNDPYINIYRTPTPSITTYSTHLNSAEFTLQKLEPRDTPDSNGYLYDIGAPIQFTEESSENIVYDGDINNTNIFTKLVSSPEVTVAGLGPGLYMLTETKAPNGFNQLTYNVFIEITLEYNEDIENWVYVRKAFIDKDNTFLKDSNPAPFTVVNDSIRDIYESIYIENFSGQLFPETGGIGTALFYATSLLLTTALLAYITASRKKKVTVKP